MTYQFDTEHAEKYGVDEAILIQNFAFWIAKNKANNKHEHEGRTWTYNSYEAFAELFPFWSKKQVRTRIESLIEQGVIIKDNFNKSAYDRTTWYAFKDEKSFLQDSQKEMTKRSNENDQTVSSSTSTDNKPYSKPKGARDEVPLPEKIENCNTVKALSDIWFNFRKENNKWPGLTEQEMLRHKLKQWGLTKSKKIVMIAMRNGWLTLKEEYVEEESTTSNSSPFRPDAIHLN